MRAWQGILTAMLVVFVLGPVCAGIEHKRLASAIGTRTIAVDPASQFTVRARLQSLAQIKSADDSVRDRIERLIEFTPQAREDARIPEAFARAMQRSKGGSLYEYRRFFAARWAEFEAMLLHYGMHPHDLSTALAFSIVSGYRAYNGDHLSDMTSGTIFRSVLAAQVAEAQWGRPWSDAHKAAVYATWGLQGALLNWFLEDAQRRNDHAQVAVVRSEARWLLVNELGRNPDSFKLDDYPCAVFHSSDCKSLMRDLRRNFTVARSP